MVSELGLQQWASMGQEGCSDRGSIPLFPVEIRLQIQQKNSLSVGVIEGVHGNFFRRCGRGSGFPSIVAEAQTAKSSDGRRKREENHGNS